MPLETVELHDSFSIIHALAYSFIGMQTLYLATHFHPIYWNTAYLIVNSGSIDEEENTQTDYTKVAKAIGEIRSNNINISLIDINKSDFGFKPDVKNNQILFGLKGLANVNNDLIKQIIANRPYTSLIDFMQKVKTNRQEMLSLIKSGGFDQFNNRKENMIEYLWLTCDKKKRITLQNLPSLIKFNLIPNNDFFKLPIRVFNFNKYLKMCCKYDNNDYLLDNRSIDFLSEINKLNLIIDNKLNIKAWDKVYQDYMDIFREWIKTNKDKILDDLNTVIFMEDWEKYAKGNIAAWEMDVLCFYYNDHELKNINNSKYGFTDFFKLPQEPVIEKIFVKGNINVPIYKLFKICGTCIAKDKTKSKIYLLTTSGVVTVSLRREHFALFDRQIFKRNPDGTKQVIERSWFNRGNMLVVQGIRRGDEFVLKKYASSRDHQIYHIDEVLSNNELKLRSERRQGEQEEENNEEN